MPQIPVMQRPVSMMEHGPNSQNLAATAMARHPVDHLQQRTAASNSDVDLDFVRHVYGSGLAMRLATEQKIAVQQEAQGLFTSHSSSFPNGGGGSSTSSSVYRDIVTGHDLKMNFSDYLSLPENRPDLPNENFHIAAERKLGL